jgi:hypothetical protein
MASTLHVAQHGSDSADGSEHSPLRTVGSASRRARPGDTVLVHEGVYREWVRPPVGGRSDRRRITYTAAPGEHVVIKGSEHVTGWEPDGDGTVWTVQIDNSVFGDFNPFSEEIEGDWLVWPDDAPRKHLGDVYLDGVSGYEVGSRAEVEDPPLRREVRDHWTDTMDRVRHPERTRLVWYAEVGPHTTTVWANFQGADPNTALVEVNVRRSVFYPVEHHIDYITVRGFELAHAACPWTPPTADQPGLIGPNWAKGWIIEDNVIHDAKCSGVSLGKEGSTGENYSTVRGDKPGYQYQLESVFSALAIGWDREHIGSHVVRGNEIYDCGQNGIVGHLGCVFSVIEDNHIHDIALKREFYGYEIAGIKLHAAIDVTIRHNRIHDCSLGTWLDWQTQGTRVSRNLLYANKRDLFVEVSHGPYLVEHNALLSPAALEIFSQGGAFVHNLVGGTLRIEPVMDRATPYHLPHSTDVAGYAVIRGGDDRFVGNVFLGGDAAEAYGPNAEAKAPAHHGTAGYAGHPDSFEAYLARVGSPRRGDHQRFHDVPQPVYAWGNVYLADAEPFDGERDALVIDGPAHAAAVEDGTEVHLDIELPDRFRDSRVDLVTGADLPPVRFVDAEFEEPDATPAVMDVDLAGVRKTADTAYPAGPLAGLADGHARIRVW